MTIKYKTEPAQTTGPRIPHVHAALLCTLSCTLSCTLTSVLCALTFDLRALFLCIAYVHTAWQTYLYEKTRERGSDDDDDATVPRTNAKRRRRINKNGAEMARDAAKNTKKAIQTHAENNKRDQILVKKADKVATHAEEYADKAEEATKVARENGKDAALKKAAKLDEDAKRAAKRACKAAKRISGGENNDDDGDNENNNGSVGDSNCPTPLS